MMQWHIFFVIFSSVDLYLFSILEILAVYSISLKIERDLNWLDGFTLEVTQIVWVLKCLVTHIVLIVKCLP